MSKRRNERLSRINEVLSEKGTMKVLDLAKEMNVTPETMRKDLDELQAHGLVIRSHGEVRPNKSEIEVPLYMRQSDNLAKKQVVAQKAISRIEDGMTVFLDSGSTLLSAVDSLRSKKDLTLVVNSMPLAQAVVELHFRVLFLGGVLLEGMQRTEGFFTEMMLDQIHLDLAIIGTCGIRNARGFGVYKDGEIGLLRKVVSNADATIVVMDNTKFEESTSFQYCRFDEVDALITNKLSDEQRKQVSSIPEVVEVDPV